MHLAPNIRRITRAAITLAGMLAVLAGAPGTGSAAAATPNSADGMITWTNCDDIAGLTNAELDTWKSRGVDGFVCVIRHLRGMGGSQDFTGDPAASLSGANYTLQRRLRDTDIAGRMRARGMKAYLGAYLVNYFNAATPLAEWFDDSGWRDRVLPKVGDLAGAAKRLGFAGLAFDHELYPQEGAHTASWSWRYPGHTRTETATRAKVKERGRQLMGAMVDGFPGLELVTYGVEFPESWNEVVQKEYNGVANAFADRLDIDFFDGLTSAEGYGALRIMDATFYKDSAPGNWETALQYHFNRTLALLSRRLSNWEHASSRLAISPFSWIDPGNECNCGWAAARPPADVAEQLQAFRKWGMDGEFADYSFNGLRAFDYSPYVEAMRAASTPAVVDAQAPALSVSSAVPADGGMKIAGTTADNLAVRVVRWKTDSGSGTAEVTWHADSGGPRTGYAWHSNWSIDAVPVEPGDGSITITVEDIKGLTTSRVIPTGGGAPPAEPVDPTPPPPPPAPAPPARPSSPPPVQRPVPPAAANPPAARRTAAERRRAARRKAARRRAARRRAARRRAARRKAARLRAARRRAALRRG